MDITDEIIQFEAEKPDPFRCPECSIRVFYYFVLEPVKCD